jgi:hypothetical protein
VFIRFLVGFAALRTNVRFFRPTLRTKYEHMFFRTHEKAAAMKSASDNIFVLGIDRVVDFATLGEYRVVTGSVEREVESRDIWATDIEWSSASIRSGREASTCSLPRARDRKLARDRVRG